MSEYIPASLRRLVVERAQNRCEYCGLAQEGQEASFHVDHVKPIKMGGPTIAENLALACVSCSLRKAAKWTVIDPETENRVRLFHPRQDIWSDHFIWNGVKIEPKTVTGRVTIQKLRMNRPIILEIRREEKDRGRHPPPRPSPTGIS